MFNSTGYNLSDIAAVSRNGDAFGGDNAVDYSIVHVRRMGQ